MEILTIPTSFLPLKEMLLPENMQIPVNIYAQ
jgi:hypothetical protein